MRVPFVIGLLLLCQSVLASDIVQVPLNSTETPLIGLAPGSGVNITFIPSERIIQKVWLDDPTWVVVDVDGCLVGFSTECEHPTATTVHLKRINPLRIEGLSPTGRSLLTVITSGESGDLKISTFRIVQRSNPGVSIVEIIPSSEEEEDEIF
ncbi:hypothetical protein [Coleofasciculus sp.]|uniref:hypothetical protein n=1 Tax=Coleofasciculus sp. TaxID=3100458 RepID=UPI003A4BBC48